MADVEVLQLYECSCMPSYHLKAGSMHTLLLKKETEIRWVQKIFAWSKATAESGVISLSVDSTLLDGLCSRDLARNYFSYKWAMMR